MNQCPSCNEPLPLVDDAFCSWCGESLDAEIDQQESESVIFYSALPVVCPSCSSKLDTGDVEKIRATWFGGVIKGVLVSVVCVAVFLVFVVILGAWIGSALFLAVFLYFSVRARRAPSTYIGRCSHCGWNDRFLVHAESEI